MTATTSGRVVNVVVTGLVGLCGRNGGVRVRCAVELFTATPPRSSGSSVRFAFKRPEVDTPSRHGSVGGSIVVLPFQCFPYVALCFGLLAALASFAVGASFQTLSEPTSSVETRTGETTITSQMDLARLVDLASERLHYRVDYDPAALRIPVSVRTPIPVADAELWPLVNQLLTVRGFTTIRGDSPGSFTVIKVADAAGASRLSPRSADSKSTPPTAPTPDNPRIDEPGFVTELIRVQYRPAKEMAESVRGVLSKNGAVSGTAVALGESNLLLIADLAMRVADARRVLESVDVPGERTIVEAIAVQQLSAAELVATITQVAAKRDSVAGHKLAGDVLLQPGGQGVLLIAPESLMPEWRQLIAGLDLRQPVETRTYTPRKFAVAEVAKLIEKTVHEADATETRWRLVTDELTGSLIITATAAQHERIASVIQRLDSVEQSAMPFRSFPIKNRPVGDLMATLSALVQAGVLDSGAASGNADDRSSIAGSASQRSGRTNTPPPAPGSTQSSTPNSSSLAAPPSAAILPSNTAPSTQPRTSTGSTNPSPRITLTADEATNTLIAVGEARLLAQLERLLPTLDVRQPQVMLDVLLVSVNDSESLDLGIELERIGKVDGAAYRLASLFGLSTVTGGARVPAVGNGFTGTVLDPGEYSVIVRALQAINKGNSLSRPKLLVANNQQATFSSVLQQPVQQLTRTGSNDTTFSFGGTEDAGTTISVKPQIAHGDHLVLTYAIKLSAFVGASTAPGLPPPKQQNAVDSVSTIPDGHTAVVGGLEILTNSNGTTQVPLLGQIPLVGELFKNRSNSVTRTRFFVFIRASVLRSNSFEDLKYLSDTDAKAANISDGFPEVHPHPIR